MRKTALLTLLALAPFPASVFAAGTVAVVVSGKVLPSAPSYEAGGELYLDAKRVGSIYGGQVYWYPVSGRVRLTLRGRAMQFVVDSKTASIGDKTLALSAPVIARAARAFVPVSFLRSEAFARWSGFDTRWDADTRTLQIERRATLGPVRAFSYAGRTRFAVDLASGLAYRTRERGVGSLEILFPFGVIDADDRVALDDGVVASYAVRQEARGARLTIRFASSKRRWKAFELASPRRLVVDVYGSAAAAAAAAPAAAVAVPEASASSSPRRRIIVIDAGHGGKDPGATGMRGVREKDLTLVAALQLARVLRERDDFQVVLTRDSDVFVPLSDRSKKANDLNADLFVSLHCNSAVNHRERGFEVYSVSETASDPEAERLAVAENAPLKLENKDPRDETARQILLAMTKTEMINESAPFGALVEREISKRVDVPDRGLKQAGFYVLRGTHAPAILVEMAFLSDAKDASELGSRRFRRKLVEGVAAGIADYARKKGWLQ